MKLEIFEINQMIITEVFDSIYINEKYYFKVFKYEH